MTHAHAHAHLNVNVMGSYGTTMRGLPFLGGDPALHHRVENAISRKDPISHRSDLSSLSSMPIGSGEIAPSRHGIHTLISINLITLNIYIYTYRISSA
jgi:hypothetical protein